MKNTMKNQLLFCIMAFCLSSCDPFYSIRIRNSSRDTLFVKANNCPDGSGLKVIDYYPDSTTKFVDRQFIYVVPPGEVMEIGVKIGDAEFHEKDIQCDSLKIRSKKLVIIARDKKTILNLFRDDNNKQKFDFVIH